MLSLRFRPIRPTVLLSPFCILENGSHYLLSTGTRGPQNHRFVCGTYGGVGSLDSL